MNEYTENGVTYRVGDRVISAPGRSAHDDDPNLTGRIVAVETDSEGTYFMIQWKGGEHPDAQGPDDFRLLSR